MALKDNSNSPFLFIHIPKTAGSSFRVAAEQYFGHDKVLYDYDLSSDITATLIKKLIYKENDRYTFKKHLIENYKFLAGHFTYPKYALLFPAKNIITFIRKPEQQIRSHYEHYVRHYNYKKDFIAFTQEERFINIQSKRLKGLPLDAYGFIGITEYYDESLALLNNYYHLNIENLSINKNDNKLYEHYSFKEEEIDIIKTLNDEDYLLYETALKRYERQKQSILQNEEFLRFHVIELPPAQAKLRLTGWYTCYEQEKAYKISILINQRKIETITAQNYHPFANERRLNRDGYISFIFQYPKSIKNGDLIEVVSEKTHEKLYSMKYHH